VRIAITGMSLATPFGVGVDALREGLCGRGRFAQPSLLPHEAFPAPRVHEVLDWDPSDVLGTKGHRHFDRLTRFLAVTARLALRASGYREGDDWGGGDTARFGVVSATAFGSLDEITEQNRIAEFEDPRYINPTRFPNTVINAAAGYVSIREELRGPNTTIVSGRTGGLLALSHARGQLEEGEVNASLVGGGEVVSEPLYVALERLGLFDRYSGLTLAEGAGFFVVERAGDVIERGGRALAYLAGEGVAFEPPADDTTMMHASARAAARALERAAGGTRVDVAVISGSAIESLTSAERDAVREVLGDVPVLAPNVTMGEAFAASGIFALGAGVLLSSDPALASELLGMAQSAPQRVAVLALGQEGQASAVVLERAGSPRGSR
jgi:3-oxoacyl-[acyl-carrier-protein] synthase II